MPSEVRACSIDGRNVDDRFGKDTARKKVVMNKELVCR
jgi:hypothetical protein